jgi:chromosome segregation ATPase
MMAVANAKVYDLVRDVMRGELAPIQSQLGTISRAVENQGTNIESLTEMMDDFGTRLAGVEAKEAATNQRIARMRVRLQQRQSSLPAVESSSTVPVDQMSEHSQEDNYQDANPYNPAFPSDDLDAEPFPPGLESPAISMQP